MAEDEEVNCLLLDGFMLGVRIMRHVHGINDSEPKHLELLTKIASGEVTTAPSCAEQELSMTDLTAHEREIARRLVEAFREPLKGK